MLIDEGAGHFADGVVQFFGKTLGPAQGKDKLAGVFNFKLQKKVYRGIDPALGWGLANWSIVGILFGGIDNIGHLFQGVKNRLSARSNNVFNLAVFGNQGLAAIRNLHKTISPETKDTIA